MNTNLLGDIRERYKYVVEVYGDTKRQVISTRPKQKPWNTDDNYMNDIDAATSSD